MPSTTTPDSPQTDIPRRKRTSRSRAKHPKFERLDIAREQQIGYDKTMARLEAISSDVDRFRTASKIATDLAKELKRLRDERHELAVGLYAYRGVRAVHEAAGMWRDSMRRVTLRMLDVDRLPTMADRADPDAPEAKKTNVVDPDAMAKLAKKARIPAIRPQNVDKALRRLVEVGRLCLRGEGTRKAAVTVRDALAIELSEYGVMTWDEASSIMGAYHGNRWMVSQRLAKEKPGT